jgi:hypothetical protein
MSYLGAPLKHDVFVSYAHADVEHKGSSDTKAWCQEFADDVRDALLRWPEFADLSFYLDESRRKGQRLDETADLEAALTTDVGRSAVLLAMMSPWYLKSSWCTKERNWWHEQSCELLPTIAQSFDRVFIVRLMDTDEKDWPELFKGKRDVAKKGFWLFDRSLPRRQRVPFGTIGNEQDKVSYRSAVIEISGLIAERLEDIKERLDEQRKNAAQHTKLLAPMGQTLYLHARPELIETFNETADRLSEAHYVILPGEPAPLPRSGRFADAQEHDLLDADAMVVLGKDHKRLDADLVVAGRNALRLAEAKSYKLLPCAVFDVEGPQQHPPRRLANARNLGIYWIDGTREDWPVQMRAWLVDATQAESTLAEVSQ